LGDLEQVLQIDMIFIISYYAAQTLWLLKQSCQQVSKNFSSQQRKEKKKALNAKLCSSSLTCADSPLLPIAI
jgi:hypothetical protein